MRFHAVTKANKVRCDDQRATLVPEPDSSAQIPAMAYLGEAWCEPSGREIGLAAQSAAACNGGTERWAIGLIVYDFDPSNKIGKVRSRAVDPGSDALLTRQKPTSFTIKDVSTFRSLLGIATSGGIVSV